MALVGRIEIRLSPVEPGRYRVEREDTGKVLGHVMGKGIHWRAQASKFAFLGDGPDGPEPIGDIVPVELIRPLAHEGDPCIPGDFHSMAAAVAGLQKYLATKRAPVMGHGPHPLVQHRERV